jgi:hypothetical protein
MKTTLEKSEEDYHYLHHQIQAAQNQSTAIALAEHSPALTAHCLQEALELHSERVKKMKTTLETSGEHETTLETSREDVNYTRNELRRCKLHSKRVKKLNEFKPSISFFRSLISFS